jgi:hypothetical protein
MSILSKIIDKLKGKKTDAQFWFGLLVSGMKSSDRNKLAEQLQYAQFAIDVASTVSDDWRIKEAKKWADGGLDILGGMD